MGIALFLLFLSNDAERDFHQSLEGLHTVTTVFLPDFKTRHLEIPSGIRTAVVTGLKQFA
jgi:hypothetical protein